MQLFDSITHPSEEGIWFNADKGNTFENLVNDLQKNRLVGACAVSMPHTDLGYFDSFYKKCKQHSGLFPVPAFQFTHPNYEEQVNYLMEIGYQAIKIHPRLSGLNLDADFEKLQAVFQLCEKHKLTIFFCTYCHHSISETPLFPTLHYVIRLLKSAPTVKIILLHGGDVSLLHYCQLARFNPNILIDISYTFLKFKNSSLEQDFRFLFNNFEKKICVGSDYPDYSISEFRQRFDELALTVQDKTKLPHIAHLNIMKFLNLI
jgi:predicted TIM-barrel fold metal-dependent hydrolase